MNLKALKLFKAPTSSSCIYHHNLSRLRFWFVAACVGKSIDLYNCEISSRESILSSFESENGFIFLCFLFHTIGPQGVVLLLRVLTKLIFPKGSDKVGLRLELWRLLPFSWCDLIIFFSLDLNDLNFIKGLFLQPFVWVRNKNNLKAVMNCLLCDTFFFLIPRADWKDKLAFFFHTFLLDFVDCVCVCISNNDLCVQVCVCVCVCVPLCVC